MTAFAPSKIVNSQRVTPLFFSDTTQVFSDSIRGKFVLGSSNNLIVAANGGSEIFDPQNSSRIISSTDGDNWTSVIGTVTGRTFGGIATNGTNWVISSAVVLSAPQILESSSPAISWTARNFSYLVDDIIYDSVTDLFYVTGLDGSTSKVSYSTDGVSWTEISLTGVSSAVLGSGVIWRCGDNLIVAVSVSNQAYYFSSADGLVWNAAVAFDAGTGSGVINDAVYDPVFDRSYLLGGQIIGWVQNDGSGLPETNGFNEISTFTNPTNASNSLVLDNPTGAVSFSRDIFSGSISSDVLTTNDFNSLDIFDLPSAFNGGALFGKAFDGNYYASGAVGAGSRIYRLNR